jgi:hypothetical protein
VCENVPFFFWRENFQRLLSGPIPRCTFLPCFGRIYYWALEKGGKFTAFFQCPIIDSSKTGKESKGRKFNDQL